VHILVIAGNTKVMPPSFLSMTALLPIQDVSGATQTHVGAALIHFGSCDASFWACNGHLLKVSITISKCAKLWVQSVCGHHPIFLRKRCIWLRTDNGRKMKDEVVLYCLK
jgi:hypothetical protein